MPRPPRLTAALVMLIAAGCGGSGLVPNLAEIFVPSLEEAFPAPNRSLEGSLSPNGDADDLLPLRVGDDEDDRGWRAFTSFTMTVPAGRTLKRAELRLHLGQMTGDPFGKLGLLFAERIDMGPALDAADVTAPAVASITGIAALPMGLNNLDVTALVQDALNRGLTRVDIRLRFGVSVVPDAVASYLHFTSFAVDTDPISLPPTLALDWE
ncbi:MAG: hypothetical protein QNJ90_12635 [Planctomycetota bacterium]|nr:hypothetical protein [Planctomycetota bacterium]